MKAAISGDFYGRIAAPPRVRATKERGRQFISLKVNRLDDADGIRPVWVSSFHGVEPYRDSLKEGDLIRVSGAIDLFEWTDAAGIARAALKIAADEITLALTEPKLKGKTKEKIAAEEPAPAASLFEDDGRKSAGNLFQGPAAPPKRGKTYDWYDKGGDGIADIFPKEEATCQI